MQPNGHRAYVGIDPGVSGGVGLIWQGRASAIPIEELPPPKMWQWLLDVTTKVGSENIVVVMEQVTGYIPKGDTKEKQSDRQPASRAFVFGESYGILKGLLVASGIEHVECVHPATWQKAVGIELERGTKKDYDEWKRKLKEYAYHLFPESRVIGKTADALLLAHYGRLKWE